MPGISLQFHMLPEEQWAFVDEMRAKHGLGVILERFWPKAALDVAPGNGLAEAVARLGKVDLVLFTYLPPRCRKPHGFNLHLGLVRHGRLEQAHLHGGSDNAAAFAMWKRLAAELKRRTTAGVWVTAAQGNVGYSKDRISPGAAAADRAGELELTMGGTVLRYTADEPPRSSGHTRTRQPSS
jgi:hypothetical protein